MQGGRRLSEDLRAGLRERRQRVGDQGVHVSVRRQGVVDRDQRVRPVSQAVGRDRQVETTDERSVGARLDDERVVDENGSVQPVVRMAAQEDIDPRTVAASLQS